MIANEKHFTKCETPNSSKIIEDKKNNTIITNKISNVDTNKNTKNDVDIKMEDKGTPGVATKYINGNGIEEKQESEDPSLLNGPKYGTVIPNRIFVGGFSAKTADEDLWRFFSSFCHITAAKIIYDRTGVSKCYGFVTFANPKDAKSIVKQHGGVMQSPMGRLRIAQAVRKQMPMFSVEADGNTPGGPPTHYYHPMPPHLQQKSQPMCIPITSYVPITQNHVVKYPPHPPPTQSVSPHDSSSVTPESPNPGIIPPHTQQPQHQSHQMNHNNNNGHGKMVGIRYAAPAHAPLPMQQQRPPSVPAPVPQAAAAAQQIYAAPQGGMMHQYVIPAMPYPQALPAYDATGLYTTCPGYATYPSYVMMAAPTYSHPAPHMGTMVPAYHPAQPPVMNSYIY